MLVGGVDTVENLVHPHPYNVFAVDDSVHGSRFACGQLVHDPMSYIVVIPPINRVIRNLIHLSLKNHRFIHKVDNGVKPSCG